MNTSPFVSVALAAILLSGVSVFGDDTAGEKGKTADTPQVGLLFEWIQVDKSEASKLLAAHSKKPSAEALRATLEKHIDGEKAELVETSYVLAKPGQRTESKSVLEFLYGTELDPPVLVNNPNAQLPQKPRRPPGTPKIPTAIDFRNVGTLIEVKPELGKREGSVHLEYELDIVRHTGSRDHDENGKMKEEVPTYQPDFHKMDSRSDVDLQSGVPALLGVLTPPGPGSKKVFLFVRANILR